MSDRHEWEDNGFTYGADEAGLFHPVTDREGRSWRDIDGNELPAAREILRLAARVKELEARLVDAYHLAYDAWARDRFGITESDNAKELRREMAGLLGRAGVPHPFGWEGAEDYPMPWEERERALAAVVAPLLPLFRERWEAWERMHGGGVTAAGTERHRLPMANTITLTAEFPVEALRALTKE